MRHCTIVVLALLFAALCCFAQDGASTSTPTWSGAWSADIKNHYWGSTVSAVFADQLVAQQELDINRRVGEKTTVALSLWDSKGFHDSFRTFADETDVSIGVTQKVGKFTVSGTGSIFFLYPGAGTHVLVLDGKISRTFSRGGNTVTPYLEVQHYTLTNKDVGYGGGLYPMVGLAYERKLTSRFSLAALFHENWDMDGGFGKTKGSNLFYAELGLRIAVTESFSVTLPRVAYGGAWDDPARDTYCGRPRVATWSGGFTKIF
jgi:hypothetical protein